MPTRRLNARFVKTVKPTRTRREYFDTQVRGLALRVTERGAKSWTLLYRHRGRLRRMTLGSLKVVSLATARDRGRDLLGAAAKGDDPAAQKQADKLAKTVEEMGTWYLEHHAKLHKKSWKQDEQYLRIYIVPPWGKRALTDITRTDVRELLDVIGKRGPILANRVRSLLHKLFNVAIELDIIENNPVAHTRRPGVETSRDRVLTEDEIRKLWASFNGLEPPMSAFYKLRLLTAQRGGEVTSMRWEDVDLKGGWWTIPATKSKNRLAHRVPLTPAVVKLLTALQPDEPTPGAYVIAGARGQRQQSEAASTFTVPDFRGHDLRRTVASTMASGGIARLTIGKILNHMDRTVTAVYDRHSYDAEKREALTWWGAKLAAMLTAKPSRTRSRKRSRRTRR